MRLAQQFRKGRMLVASLLLGASFVTVPAPHAHAKKGANQPAAQPEPEPVPAPPLIVAPELPPVVELEAYSPDQPGPAAAKSAEVSAEQSVASTLMLRLDTALDLSAAGYWPMVSTRLDLRLRLPLAFGPAAEFGLRSGYSYHAYKGPAQAAGLGFDNAAYLKAHCIPIYLVAGLSSGLGNKALFGMPARLSAYGAAGTQITVGEAHAFGRTEQVLGAVPSVALGAALELALSQDITFGLFGEWELLALQLDEVPGISSDLSGARLGLTLSYGFGL